MKNIPDCINTKLFVEIGAKVLFEIDGKSQEWQIVDAGEANITAGKISYQSPLAQCILGASEGSVIKSEIMGKDMRIVIRRIRQSR